MNNKVRKTRAKRVKVSNTKSKVDRGTQSNTKSNDKYSYDPRIDKTDKYRPRKPIKVKSRIRNNQLVLIYTITVILLFIAISLMIWTIRNDLREDVINKSSSTKDLVTSKIELQSTTPSTNPVTIPWSTFNGNIPNNVEQAFISAGANESYSSTHPYCIAVNTVQNIVIVYTQAEDGTFTKPYKAMVASCGKAETPTKSGTFKTVEKYIWRALNGGVYGQYATRIDGPYLFHSVPYYRQSPDSLETEEYNHLGENRSLGCVRLAVADCKWIYDNCPLGTIVTLYADGSVNEPLPKPSSIQVPLSGEQSGWDPTDPDIMNPW